MSSYDIGDVIKQFEAQRKMIEQRVKATGKEPDVDTVRKFDDALMKAMNASFVDIKNYFDKFDALVSGSKKQAKMRWDAIERTFKDKKGVIRENDWKLLNNDLATIKTLADTLGKETTKQGSTFLQWRGGWPEAARQMALDKQRVGQFVDLLQKERQKQIGLGTSSWFPEIERVKTYVVRGEALFTAAKKGAGSAGDAELAKFQKLLQDALTTGGGKKNLLYALGNADAWLQEEKSSLKSIKAALPPPQAKLMADRRADRLGIAKQVRGAVKTLEMLEKLVTNTMKSSDKADRAEWKALIKEVHEKLKASKKCEKTFEEFEKIGKKVAELEQKGPKK